MKISNLNINKEEIAIAFNGEVIKIKTYLPIAEKVDLINKVIEASIDEETNLVNKIIADVLFSYMIVKTYSDIELDIDKINEEYDILESNGIIDIIFKNIPQTEIKTLLEYFEIAIDQHNKYHLSPIGFLDVANKILENKTENIFAILQNINKDEFKELKNLFETSYPLLDNGQN